jgi:hypothetical protein
MAVGLKYLLSTKLEQNIFCTRIISKTTTWSNLNKDAPYRSMQREKKSCDKVEKSKNANFNFYGLFVE